MAQHVKELQTAFCKLYINIYSGFVTAGADFRILPAMLSYSPSPRVVGSSAPFLGVYSHSSLV